MVNGSHAYARRARFQPQFCFFAVTSVTHEEKKRENEKKNSAKRKDGTLDFNVVSISLCVLYSLVC